MKTIQHFTTKRKKKKKNGWKRKKKNGWMEEEEAEINDHYEKDENIDKLITEDYSNLII